MVQTVAIKSVVTEAIASLSEAHDKFNLSYNRDPQFFTEWQQELPEIKSELKAELDRLKNRYFYYLENGELTEGTVGIVVLHPLLNLLGLVDPPYRILSEKYVRVETAEPDGTVLEGRIDALVIQQQFWVVVIEAKAQSYNVWKAIPQTLAYMMGNPHPSRPTFGLVTNGDDYLFIKLFINLEQQDKLQYAFSDKFTLTNPTSNELYDVARLMLYIANLCTTG